MAIGGFSSEALLQPAQKPRAGLIRGRQERRDKRYTGRPPAQLYVAVL
jgi:hypothetical protein